jgi:murein DD-endopeptidase MepM/ murein hydrolase activator NlpD
VVRLLPRGRTSTKAAGPLTTEDNDDGTGPWWRGRARVPLDLHGRRLAAAGTAGVLVAAVALPALTAWGADEDDLKHRRSQVSGQLRNARGDLGESSAELNRAARRLEAAQGRLDAAEDYLSRTRDQLQQAIEYDAMMQERLDEAEARLEAARIDLAEGRRAVARQRSRLAEFAAESFQNEDNRLLELRVFLKSETPEALTTQMDAVDSISSKQSASFARLRASEVLLRVEEEEVEAAKEEVAAERAEAARNLEEKERLEAEAEAAEERVSELVAAREEAEQQAEDAKAEDLAQVEQLEAEREQIQDRLAELARRQAAALARAQAAARARSAAAAAAAAQAAAAAADGLMSPVNSYITSSYGMRYHPILHYRKLHDGTDFGAACGTPVRAADDGRVISAYYSTGYGNQVLINHGIENGVSLSTSYNHLSRYGVSPGEQVSRGEVIGLAGTTGYSTGCHLHFMVYENGGTVDPMSWL